MANPLSFLKLKPMTAELNDAPSFRNMSTQDKLLMLSAAFQDNDDMMAKIPLLAAARAQQARRSRDESDLSGFLNGGAANVPRLAMVPGKTIGEDAPPPPLSATEQISQSLSGDQPVPTIKAPGLNFTPDIPMVVGGGKGRSGPITMRDAIPFLTRLAQDGGDIKDYVAMINAAQPDNGTVGSWVYDKHDPKAQRFYEDAPTKGSKPAFDQDGRQIGWLLENGTLQAIQSAKEAEKLGETRGTLFPDLPSRSGKPVAMTGGQFLDGQGVVAGHGSGGASAGGQDGVGVGQSPGEKAEDIARGEAKAGRAKLAPAQLSAMKNQAVATDSVLSDIDAILGDGKNNKGMISGGLLGTSGIGSLGRFIPGTPQRNLHEKLQHIRAVTGFEALQAMRKDSPTGGALGQISDFENKLLQSVLESLAQEQSPEQLRDNLAEIRSRLRMAKQMREEAFQREYADVSTTAGGAPAAANVSLEAIDAEIARRKKHGGH